MIFIFIEVEINTFSVVFILQTQDLQIPIFTLPLKYFCRWFVGLYPTVETSRHIFGHIIETIRAVFCIKKHVRQHNLLYLNVVKPMNGSEMFPYFLDTFLDTFILLSFENLIR